ncbi:tripartite tricarboxylate transporter permease [Agrobacterium genomosp. 3]|uniref:tripartite tricarboxylate transporter permease n=1 Tax=Agrobacterium tomkonis TaxID=1183410 RepID=UPI001CD8661F|nr:tripartite tricarboxylate transporter permease [Agrobacterium tomkonis]MCA1879274.1 tripartite tricarboxylate transporter permease [Agrobacterium tumefaciens]MCA1894437.1 tripartite tricarboxylate transporter permease [Agrobacterium tomkonis]
MDGFTQFLSAVLAIGLSADLVVVVWATLLGIVVGMIPGLTATLGVALVTTLTFTMEPNTAILVLISVYIGAIYGGGRTAILLNIPGTPANAASALDGFPLAKQGRAGEAMAVATTGSFLGSMVGMLGLAIIAPWLAEFALDFTSFEFFWLAVFGIVLCGQLTAMDDPLKGWIAGFFGLLIAMVGQEALHAYPRFSYGVPDLEGGLGLLPVLVGAFGCAEVFVVMRQEATQLVASKVGNVLSSALSSFRFAKTWLRSGTIGTFMGVVPGVGEDMGAWVSYAAAKRASKTPEEFGKGSADGLLAAETGNNAAVPGALIPVLTLAIPGSAPAAVLLAAMIIHGLRPGPLIMITQADFFYSVVAMVFWASVAMLVLGLMLTRPLLYVLRIRREWLMGTIFVLCVVGSFAIAGRIFDVWVMIAFGLIGFVMRETGFPVAPMILGVVLGPILDNNLRRSLSISQGDPLQFVSRPISIVIACMVLAIILLSLPPAQNALRAALVRLSSRGGRGADG